MTDDSEGFLRRWSRLKHQSGDGHDKGAESLTDSPSELPPELPPLETLGPDSDFSAFMHPKVEPALRRAALAKLFRSPQFQAMDGLDVYIDDYSNPAPLAPAVAAGLRHARALFAQAEDAAAADTVEKHATRVPPAVNAPSEPASKAPALDDPASAQALPAQAAADDQRLVEGNAPADRDNGDRT